MARYPYAKWHPSPNFTPGNKPRIYVLHIMQGSLAGTDSWFTKDAAVAEASAHFGIGKDGTVIQWVDTADRSWNCVDGNAYTIGVEHEGFTGEKLTAAQIAADHKLATWCQEQHGIPLTSTGNVSGKGIGWHGMGGADWGGYLDCSGKPIIAQRDLIEADAPAKPASKTWKTEGKRSLVAIAKNQHMMASTILRCTCRNSPGGKFPDALASYVNGGDLVKAKVPAGVELFLNKPGPAAAKGTGGAELTTDGASPLKMIAHGNRVTMSVILRETIAHYGEFDPITARYISGGDLTVADIPAGAKLWIPPAEWK